MSKKKFYDIKPIIKIGADFNLIYGQKGNGKTTTTLQYVLKEYVDKGYEFIILRRWREDFQGGRAKNFFSEIASRGYINEITKGEWQDVYYYQSCWYFCRYDSKGCRITDIKPFAYARALTNYEHDNGNQYPNVHYIVFDEFITTGELANEFDTFFKVYDNIRRRKDYFKVFMLGNTVNFFSTYWGNFGITNIHNQKPGTIDVYKVNEEGVEVVVACEYCENIISAKEKATISAFASRSSKLNMITSGQWEIGSYPRPPKFKPQDIVFTFFIQFYEYLFQCEIVNLDNGMFLNIHRKTTELQDPENDIIYSNEFHYELNYRRNILVANDTLGQLINKLFKTDKVFYGSNEDGNVIDSYINWCKGGRNER